MLLVLVNNGFTLLMKFTLVQTILCCSKVDANKFTGMGISIQNCHLGK